MDQWLYDVFLLPKEQYKYVGPMHVCGTHCIASYFGTQDIYRSSGGLKGQPVPWLILQVKQYTNDVKGIDIRETNMNKRYLIQVTIYTYV